MGRRIAALFTTLTLGLTLGACTTMNESATRELLNDPSRSAADRARDASSKPLEVLKFFGLKSGDTVLDLFAGTAYYSEIAAASVGPDGIVYAHNNAEYLKFAGEGLEQRLAATSMDNLKRYDREIDRIDLADDSVDMVMMILSYHDIYYVTEGWALDGDALFSEIRRVLKPGGVLGIVDHEGRRGSGSTDAQELHRIDPEFAKRDIERHGFEFTGSSDLLRNSTDNLEITVFDESVRRRTSRFIDRFRKP